MILVGVFFSKLFSRGRDRIVVGFTVQSVPITTKVVSLNPVHGEVYSIQHYVIKFSPGTLVSSTNKSDCHHIIEKLLKLALNTINQTYYFISKCPYR